MKILTVTEAFDEFLINLSKTDPGQKITEEQVVDYTKQWLSTYIQELIGEDEATDSDKFSSDPNICFGRTYRDKLRAELRLKAGLK